MKVLLGYRYFLSFLEKIRLCVSSTLLPYFDTLSVNKNDWAESIYGEQKKEISLLLSYIAIWEVSGRGSQDIFGKQGRKMVVKI